MGAVAATSILSHWNHMVPGMQQSSAEFYGAIDEHLKSQGLDDTKTERVNIAEGGILSAKREYLQVRRKEHVFHICAAPFGSGFFVSWWLGEVESGLWAMLSGIPYIGFIFRLLASVAKPTTYYRIDTAMMFQSATHGAVLATLDAVTSAKGMRALSESERKPITRDFFSKLGGGGK
jgi:hypothetical protein